MKKVEKIEKLRKLKNEKKKLLPSLWALDRASGIQYGHFEELNLLYDLAAVGIEDR